MAGASGSATICAGLIHDPEGRLVEPIARGATGLRALFAGFALSLTEATDGRVAAALETHLGASVLRHPTGEAIIGQARRGAVVAALRLAGEAVLYSDFDHLVRWAARDAAEIAHLLADRPALDLLVIGRSPAAFAAEPRRLQETERVVNHIYTLMTGREWDLLFAVRRFSRRGAEAIMAASRIETLANDVEWPLLADRLGLIIGYAAADGLYYRTMEDFAAPADRHDDSPHEWIRRIGFAMDEAAVLRSFLDPAAR